jgi:hypothetical protein
MLREIFRTEPLKYYSESYPNPSYPSSDGPFGTLDIIPPYSENLFYLLGMTVAPYNPGFQTTPGNPAGQGELPDSPLSIYVFSVNNQRQYPSWGFGYWRMNGKTGKFVSRPRTPSFGGGGLFNMFGVITSRNGVVYAISLFGSIHSITLGSFATAYVDVEQPEGPEGIDDDGDSWEIIDEFPISRFGPYNEAGDVMEQFGVCAIDDKADTFLNAQFQNVSRDVFVYTLSTGVFRYSFQMPNIITQICLEDDSRCYILLRGRILVLFDYERNEVLGASRIPSRLDTEIHEYYEDSLDMRISWDPVFRRLLVLEQLPDNPDGSCATYVRGFRNVPEPVRVTTPIPLMAPRQRRMIPVLVQCLGDMNEGVGGYVIQAQVTGAGSQAGVPISDGQGNTRIMVACEGHEAFAPSPATNWWETGSPEADPPHTGLINIRATAQVYMPDPNDIPVSGGKSRSGDGTGGDQPPGTPGPPGGDEGGHDPESGATAQAPDMTYIMERVLASGNWNLQEYNEDAPNGRGKFTEVSVTAMHDVDARFGHVSKSGSQNQYNGHAVDALCFKRDDGVMAEIYDIVSGQGSIGWGLAHGGISTANLAKWKYPA